MTNLLHDLRYALRQLGKNPGFAATAVITLALGIGATTAIFSVVYGVLLRPLPYNDPNRIAAIFEGFPQGGRTNLADPNFDDFRDQNRSFQAIAKYAAGVDSVAGGSQPTRSMMAVVSPDFFRVFRVQPAIGRAFSASDAHQGAAPTVVVSYAYWKQYLRSSLNFSQLNLKIDNKIYSVIGVMPAEFRFPADAELWLPTDLDGETPSRTAHNFQAVGRLRDGATIAQANADLSAIARRIHDTSSEQSEYLLNQATVIPLQESMTGEVRPALLILLGAVGFLLLVACANVANLLLAQASARERELAVRSALGAPRRRLVRQFLTESGLLALMGGGLGVLAGYSGVAGLIALSPPNLPRLHDVALNVPVLLFSLALSALVAVGLGTFTAMRGTSRNVREGLGEGGRSQVGSYRSQRLTRGIVAAQIAITLVLVVGAGLLGRSLMKAVDVDPGFRVDKIIAMDVNVPSVQLTDLPGKAGESVFFASLLGRLKQIPGVRNVGAVSTLPMEPGGLPNFVFALMRPEELPRHTRNLDELVQQLELFFRQKERLGVADFCVATDGYFQVLGIPLLHGRMFDERDGADAPHVALISESLAHQRWPGQDPIGHTLQVGGMDGDIRLVTIVGVVGDVHEYGLDAPPRPTIYVDLLQRPRAAITITMLSDADTQSVTAAARGVLHDLNPEIPVNFRTFSQVYSDSLGARRFNVILMGFFATIALLLAVIGVFGVMAYSVSRRTREIGVRVALGARPRDVVTMILGQGSRTILLGVAVGLAGSLLLTRTVKSMLFGVTATDPLTFATVILALAGAALLACYLPARRAARVDPMEALRYE